LVSQLGPVPLEELISQAVKPIFVVIVPSFICTCLGLFLVEVKRDFGSGIITP
jgi:hypothetical protein